ncbi:glycine cleavage system protein H [Paenibacillus ferrarius]|uniref:glycine cleavage system protein H n=1 Tax=Paenibacillus ferrarius TaxID=1469647 RepID=UPI003D26E0BA
MIDNESDNDHDEAFYWIRDEGTHAVVGLTEAALERWGMILFIELPEVGAELKEGAYMGLVETAESEWDLIAPISGKVTSINLLLERSTELLYASPTVKGWLLRLEKA